MVMDERLDGTLVEQAQAGDRDAFAELYARWFDAVYDFAARMTRNREAAEDIARETFETAMNGLGGLPAGGSFKSWTFTIARNAALHRTGSVATTPAIDFDDPDVVEGGRFGSTAEAAEARALAAFVWTAAAELDHRQLSLLDLHLRQGLESDEIAAVLGVTRRNGLVTLTRLKVAAGDALDASVATKHEGKPRMSALAVFGALAAIAAPSDLKADILAGLMRQWPGAASGWQYPSAAVMLPGAGVDPSGFAPGLVRGGGKYVVGGGMAALLLLGVFFVPASPISLLDDDRTSPQNAADPTDMTNTPGVGGTKTATPTRTPGPATVSPSASPTPTSAPGGAVLPTPGASATPTGTTGPGTPTPTSTAIPPTSTSTPTASPTAAPTPTSIPCGASISTNIGILNMPPIGSAPFTLLASCNSSSFTIRGGDGWAAASPTSGTVTFGSLRTIQVTVDAARLSEGPHSTTLVVQGENNSASVVVRTTVPGENPAVSVTSVGCSPTSATFAVSAAVTDDFRVSSVVVRLVTNGVGTDYELSGPDGATSGTWERSISGVTGTTSWTVIATDGVGHTGTASGNC